MKGRVSLWNNQKQYGFIEYSDKSNRFVYLDKSIKNNIKLKEGQKIEFELAQNSEKTYLKKVKKIRK